MKTRLVPIRLGEVTLFQIIETEIGPGVQEILDRPEFTPDLARISWLQPHYVDAEGRMKALVQSFLLPIGQRLVLVDACLGNDKRRTTMGKWNRLQSDFLDTFAKTGFAPEDVTDVLCTHMHVDHVGWNTRLIAGRLVPTFPKARYYFAEREYEYWRANPPKAAVHDREAFADSIAPVIAAGQAVFVAQDADLGDGISLVPTPGHTPGHVSIRFDLADGEIFVTGDCIHHPCQVARVAWSSTIDHDTETACRSRGALLQSAAARGSLLWGSHFALPSIGRVALSDDWDFRFEGL